MTITRLLPKAETGSLTNKATRTAFLSEFSNGHAQSRSADDCRSGSLRYLLSAALFMILLFGSQIAYAQNYYIRSNATGAKNGSDWTNAFTNLPATLVRGDVYYIASGTYGNYTFANVSGTAPVTVKKATVSDHGTNTGWNDSYANGQAVFTGWTMRMSNLVIDGQTGGGPGAWDKGHGIAVRDLSDHLIYQGGGDPAISNVTLRHIEIDGTSTASADRDLVYLTGGASDITMQYMYIHDAGCDIFQLRNNITRFTLEYSKVARNTSSASCHGDVFEYDSGTASDWTHRYNWFDDCEGTYLWGTHESGTFTGAKIYGNVISGGDMANGMISALSGGGVISNLKFYNNTIANVGGYNAGFNYLSRGTNNSIYNNIWYNSPADLGGTHDYNWFYGSRTQSEAHIQNGSGSPFVDIASKNFALKAATNSGTNLGAPYNVSIEGSPRGADGVWDRGAYEYGSGAGGGLVPVPANLRTVP